MGSVFGELPALSFELEVVGDKGPVECRHPVCDVVVFLDPASLSCWVVTLLVCSKRTTSLAASWMVGSKVVTQCWISGWLQPSGISSCNVGCGGCKTSARAGGFGGGGVGACDGAADADGRLVLFTGVSGSPN